MSVAVSPGPRRLLPPPGCRAGRPQSSKESGPVDSPSHPVAGPIPTVLLAPASLSASEAPNWPVSTDSSPLLTCPPQPSAPGRASSREGRAWVIPGDRDLSPRRNRHLSLLAWRPADWEGCINLQSKPLCNTSCDKIVTLDVAE